MSFLETMRSSRRVLNTAVWACLVSIPPLLILVRLAGMDAPIAELEGSPDAIEVKPTPTEFREERAIKISPTVEDPVELYLTASEPGLITRVFVEGGTMLTDLEPVVAVNGRNIVFASGETPFWRSLRLGDRGPDVLALRNLLLSQYEDELGPFQGALSDSDEFDSDMVKLVRWLSGSVIGLSEPVDEFDPSWVTYSPVSTFEVADVSIRVGQSIMGETVVALSRAEVVEVTLLQPDSGAIIELPPDWTVRTPLGAATVGDAEALRGLMQEVAESAGAEVPEGQQDAAVAHNAIAVAPRATDAFSVPSTSVLVDREGRTCVFTRASSDATAAGEIGAVAVGLLAVEGGTATVEAESSGLDDVQVTANPSEVGLKSCA